MENERQGIDGYMESVLLLFVIWLSLDLDAQCASLHAVGIICDFLDSIE